LFRIERQTFKNFHKLEDAEEYVTKTEMSSLIEDNQMPDNIRLASRRSDPKRNRSSNSSIASDAEAALSALKIQAVNSDINLKRKVVITQYAPETFKAIRQMSNVSEHELLNSLRASDNVE